MSRLLVDRPQGAVEDELGGGRVIESLEERAGREVANPPGELPQAEIEARLAALAWQFRHDNTIAPLAPSPGEPVEIYTTSGGALPLERAVVFYTADGSWPGPGASELPMRAAVEWDARAGYLTRWQAMLPAQPDGTVVRYRIAGWRAGTGSAPERDPDLWAHDGQGFWYRFPSERGITTFAYRVESPQLAMPAWATDAVIYHIFLDRFHPGDAEGIFADGAAPIARHGGTLRGVRRALGYLRDLGVNCLWLSPLCASDSYHRYDTTDLYRVDPALGTEQDLRDLVDEAHAHGLRVLLDLVPSHCSWRHPAFEAARRDSAAPTASWFTFDEWPDHYRRFLGTVASLPSFNTDNPEARDHIIGSAVQWLRDYGVDGFRLDHAMGPSMDFWVAFRAATRAVAPASFSVGEVTDTPDSLRRYRGRLDSVLDFPLARALRLTFGVDAWSVSRLDAFLDAHEAYMAAGPGRVSFLDNHDMNRFLFVAGDDVTRLKLAALCQFTLEATPTIYYGTEIGLAQRHDIAERDFGGDAEARRDMPWDPAAWDHDLLTFYRALIRLRRDHAALRHGARRTVYLDDEAGAYAYLRSLTLGDGAEDVLSVFNVSTQEQTIVLSLDAGAWTCLLATGTAPHLGSTVSSHLTLTLAPHSGAVLAPSHQTTLV